MAELRQTAKLAAAKKEADEETREEELDRRRKTAAPVPAMEAMTREELAPARPRETKEVLEVWRRGSERAGHCGIERSAHRGEEQDCGDARADLEAAVGDVTVRHPIADEVEEQSEWQRAEPRTDERAAGSPGRNVKGGDQAASLASRCRLSALVRQPGAGSVRLDDGSREPGLGTCRWAFRLGFALCWALGRQVKLFGAGA